MSGAFPGARNPDELWTRLCNGEEAIRFLASQQCKSNLEGSAKRGNFVPAVAAMDDVDLFDAEFFGMTSVEAELTDPQHRILLEHAWRGLEHAGYDSQRYEGRIGLFAGATINTYLIENLITNRAAMQAIDPLQLNIASAGDFLTTRISYKLNLTGPAHTVQSACSTSLVAVHCACRSLLDLECDIAMAGAVSINVNLLRGYQYQEGGIMSRDGHCRVFDAAASGTIFGSGVGIVVLKRLEDALAERDNLLAIIKGSAVNNDGAMKLGYTAPSVAGQVAVIAEALGSAGVNPETIGYVECHGTGTPLGDPVEIRAMNRAFQEETNKRGFCAVGSVKSNIGHLDAAAGIAGLIKVIFSLQRGMLPPSLHFREANPEIDFDHSSFYVNTTLSKWNNDGRPRRAGINAFGVGGTNAHIVLEEAPEQIREKVAESWHLLPLSARTDKALRKTAENLAAYLHQCSKAELANVVYTLQIGRRQFAHRWTTVCRTLQDAIAALQAGIPDLTREATKEESNRIAFLFPGEDSQNISMGRDLYRNEETFRQNMQRCGEILRPQLGMNICDALGGESWGDAEEPWLGQPALFAIEYSLAQLWMSWGIYPQAMLGYGLGEYAAACIAGVLSLEDALTVVAVRGKLMQEMAPGAMLAVPLSESQLNSMLPDGICLAAINAPNLCTLAGTRQDLENLKASLQARAPNCRWLKTSRGLHSSLMDAMMEPFLAQARQVRRLAPRIPFISNLTGEWITDAQAQDPAYWVSHLRQPVQFERGLQHLTGDPEWTMVEVGPGQTLRQLIQSQKPSVLAVCSMPGDGTSETKSMLQALGQLWEAGIVIDWKALYSGKGCNRVPLPTYPFEKKRYWIEPAEESTETTKPDARGVKTSNRYSKRPILGNDYVPPQNEMERQIVTVIENALGIRPVGVTDKYGELGGDSLTAIRIIDELNSSFHRNLRVADLYEGLAVRDLISLMGYGSPIESGDSRHEQEGIERRRLYQKHRRTLHEIEPS